MAKGNIAYANCLIVIIMSATAIKATIAATATTTASASAPASGSTTTTTATVLSPSATSLQTVKQWKLLAYNFLPQQPVHDMNFYNPMNVLITGLAVSGDRIFIATPKLFSGVSSTLSYVPKVEFVESPALRAYPDWSYSTTARTDFNCSDLALVSVYRLRIDSCNRLWVLDAGVSRSLEDFEVTCPPKILVIDLKTDAVVRRIEFPPEILRGESLFTNLVIDETTSKSGTCDDVFVYITDTVEPAIVVYDSERDVTWRLTHPAMYPDPDFAQSEILNDRFVLMDGIVGLTFDEKAAIVYFQPLATDRIFSITREVLRAGPLPINQVLPVKLVGKKSSQGIGLAVSPIDGSILFSPLSETAIASWNPHTNRQQVIAHDRDRLQFVADMSVSRSEPGVIYAVSSKFHRFFLKNLNPNEINNRIMRIELPGAVPLATLPRHGSLVDHQSLEPFLASLPGYALKPFIGSGSGLYPSSAYKSTTPRVTSFFSNATPFGSAKHPYAYESNGLINYSERNPFTALNQGETFPPSREQRNQYQQLSFLDTLAAQPLSSSNFFTRRTIRHTQQQQQQQQQSTDEVQSHRA